MRELLECRALRSGLLRDATFDLERGQITAILGPVDSGTDVLRRILEGSEGEYSGQILVAGEPVQLRSVMQAQNLGIFSIGYEELLLPNMTIYENIGVLNGLERKGIFIRRRWARKQAGYLMERFGVNASLDALPGELTDYLRHEVEILKAINCGAALIIFSDFFEEYSQEERSLLARRLRFLSRLGISALVLLEKPYVGWETLFDKVIFMEQGVSGVTVVGRNRVDVLRKWAYSRTAPERTGTPAKGLAVDGAAATVLDAGTGERLLTVEKGDLIGILDQDRIFPRRADEAELWLERRFSVEIRGQIYAIKALKRKGIRIGIVCNRFGASPVLESWSVVENISYSACQVYSPRGLVNRRVSNYIARQTLESADYFAPLLKHLDEKNCEALDNSCRRRLETARAFAAKPDVIVFAHAASQLNAKETQQLHTLIRDKARNRDCVYIVIESDEYELAQLGVDRLYRLTHQPDGTAGII